MSRTSLGGAPRRSGYTHILDRIRSTLASATYLAPSAAAPTEQREVLGQIGAAIEAGVDPEAVRRRIHQLHAAGRLDRVMMLSALGVLAASPQVRDWAEAARLASQQEFAALDQGGPERDRNLASAHRHRGVIAFLRGWYPVALDWFTRALEKERTAENLGNVLAALIRLGELDEARALLASGGLGPSGTEELGRRIAADEDLARLRP